MQRRNFLKLSVAGASALLTPSFLEAYDYPIYDGPLWIFVHAVGGWDPTMICNPQPEINNLDWTKTAKRAGNIDYLAQDRENNTVMDDFFQNHHEEMLIINGVNAQTNSHTDRYFVSGQLEAGYPTFGSVLSDVYRKESPMGHILSGNAYRYSAGLGSSVGVRNGRDMIDLIFTRSPGHKTPTYTQSINDRLDRAKRARQERLLNKKHSKAVQADLHEYIQSHKSSERLQDVVDQLPKGDTSGSLAVGKTHLGIAGYASNQMTIAINTAHSGVGGFDQHGAMDSDHPKSIIAYFEFVQDIIDDAKAMEVWDDTVLVLFSEMGRTAEYNSIAGKDHWPVTSTILMGPRVQGNKVIGGTTKQLEPTKLNPETLELDEEGEEITFADLNELFRRYSKIEESSAAKKYKLESKRFNLERFFKV